LVVDSQVVAQEFEVFGWALMAAPGMESQSCARPVRPHREGLAFFSL